MTGRTLPIACMQPATHRIYPREYMKNGVFLCHACAQEMMQLTRMLGIPGVVLDEVSPVVGATCGRIKQMELPAEAEQ